MTHPESPTPEAPRPARRFTVLLPVLRPPVMLPHAIRSVLRQTEGDLELCIVGDGAPAETIDAARAFARDDPRVHVFPFAKGARHGEAHRAAVLRGAQSRFVAQIGDDDLWFADHLARLGRLLARADFVSLPQTRLIDDDTLLSASFWFDLRDPASRARMLREPFNFFGPSEAGYRLSAYRALPEGWSPAPPDLPSDLFMWRKFLTHPGLTFGTGFVPTSLKFGADDWKTIPLTRRAEIIARWAAVLEDPDQARALRRRATRAIAARSPLAELGPLLLRTPDEGAGLILLRIEHALRRRIGWARA